VREVLRYYGNGEPLNGILIASFGILVARIVCESWILFYRMNDTLTRILREQEKANRR
jgi:hypothetical protein